MTWIIISVCVVVVIATGAALFARSRRQFSRQRNLIQESWLQIEVQLHRRYDLIPELLEAARTHSLPADRGLSDIDRLLSEVPVSAEPSDGVRGPGNSDRGPGPTGVDLAQRTRYEVALSKALREVLDSVANRPDLRSRQEFVSLQQQLAETEDRVVSGRRFYNGNVRRYNTRVETFPSKFVARGLHFDKAEYFDADGSEIRTAPHDENV